MLQTVFGLFSLDLALDLGSTRTRIAVRGKGTVIDEPAVVAVHTDRWGRRNILSVGEDARTMIGRTPPDIEAVQPIRGGTIEHYEVAEALMVHLLRRLHGRNRWMSPRMVVTVPGATGEMERRAVRECCEAAGAREVHLIPKALAAALGTGLPVHEPSGLMVVDVGGGGTETSVLALNGVVNCRWVPGGGDGFDTAIINYLRDEYGLMIGRLSAERLKLTLGRALGGSDDEALIVAGRDLVTGVPRSQRVSGADVTAALRLKIDEIALGIRQTIESTPPELASDVVENGIVLVGGGGNLPELDRALTERTGLPVVGIEAPEHACIDGANRAIQELDLLERMAS